MNTFNAGETVEIAEDTTIKGLFGYYGAPKGMKGEVMEWSAKKKAYAVTFDPHKIRYQYMRPQDLLKITQE